MVASMIALGPHEMKTWLWVFGIGLTASLALPAALSFSRALRVPRRPERSDG